MAIYPISEVIKMLKKLEININATKYIATKNISGALFSVKAVFHWMC